MSPEGPAADAGGGAPGPLRVVAHVVAREGREDELRRVLLGLVEPTRAEAGCRLYELLEAEEHPGRFTFVETWTDHAALDAHLASPHFRDAERRLPDLAAGEPEIVIYRTVA